MIDCIPSFPSRRHTFLVVLTACALTVAVVGLAATLALTSYRATLVSAGQNARFISSLVANQMGMALIDICRSSPRFRATRCSTPGGGMP